MEHKVTLEAPNGSFIFVILNLNSVSSGGKLLINGPEDFSVEPTTKMKEWATANNVQDFKIRFDVDRVVIDFATPSDAMICKLTWGSE